MKVRVYEKADKFSVGKTGNKGKKFVEAAKGTNLFFAILGTEKENPETGQTEVVRSYATIPLNVMIDCQKKYGKTWSNNIEVYLKEKELISSENRLLFILSPQDLVYLPTENDLRTGITKVILNRIYKFVSCTSNEAHMVPSYIASPIIQTTELGSNNKSQKAWTGEMIKETCIPIKVDRLGNIIELNGTPI